jgi:hypothetical protein
VTTDELPEWAQKFLHRIKRLEDVVNAEHTPAIDELDDKVEEHDRTLKHLISEQTVIKLILGGVDKKLDRVLAAVEKDCECE